MKNSDGQMVDVVVLGAGPYGLSLAAHLAQTKLKTRVFGRPMQSWRDHMPRGMKLKSDGFASSLYDPESKFPLRVYCRENDIPYADIGLPIPVEVFIAYGIEFQRRMVPHLEQTDIASIRRVPGGFAIETESGESFETRSVVVAAGIAHFAWLPEFLAGLPPEYVSHSFGHNDLTGFRGRKVAVIGAGASAVDMAALLRDAGAEVEIVARRAQIAFHEQGAEPRSLLDQIRSPRSGLGVGWKSRICADLPLLFHALPEKLRFRAVERHLGPAPGWFVVDKVRGQIPAHLKAKMHDAFVRDGKVHLKLTERDGTPSTLVVDHIVAGTGFKVSLKKLPVLDEELRAEIRNVDDTPILSRNFESSVPGLYFVGLASSNSFGPLTRFACGAEFTSKHLTKRFVRLGGAETAAQRGLRPKFSRVQMSGLKQEPSSAASSKAT